MKKALPILLFMVFVFVLMVGLVTYYIQDNLAPIDNRALASWIDSQWRHRLTIKVTSEVTTYDRHVAHSLDFNEFVDNLNNQNKIDIKSMRLLELNQNDQVVNLNVPYQFEYLSGSLTEGVLYWILNDETSANQQRYFQLYFDLENRNLPETEIDKLVTVTDNLNYKNYQSIKIETESTEYYYHKTGGGFASIIDKDNKDWLSWNSSTGAQGDFRGIPNMVHPNDGGYFHPGRTGVTTTLLSSGPIKSSFKSSIGTQWEVLWDVYPEYAEMTVTKAPSDKKYWFLYEGTPGGELNLSSDTITKSDGTKIFASQEWANDIEDKEWVFVSDGEINRSLYLIHHIDDEFIDAYHDMDHMTVFGFGRNKNNRYLSGINRKFTLGFRDSRTFQDIEKLVNGIYAEPEVTEIDFEVYSEDIPTSTPDLQNTPTLSPTPDLANSPTPTPTLTDTPLFTITPTPTLMDDTPPVSVIVTPTITPSPTLSGETICGKADINDDGKFTIGDFTVFAQTYKNGKGSCSDSQIDYGPCGGKDVNRDGKLNISDFGAQGIGFAQRYYPKQSCSL